MLLSPLFLKFSLDRPRPDVEDQIFSNKALKTLMSKLIYMEGGTFTMGAIQSHESRMTTSDSTLFSFNTPRRAVVDPFYINATEVTNEEWRKFYTEKVIELGKERATRKFYPDTSLWIKEFPYTYIEPMAKNYFSHPAFNDYPVVGITWDQANAYCSWKSQKLQTLLDKIGIKSTVEFRLPSEAEWEFAAITNKDEKKHKNQADYTSARRSRMAQLNDLQNIGQIHDINKVVLKQYADDGCLYTCKVATYPPNNCGLYNMAGNVSEWTIDQGIVWSFGSKNRRSKKLASKAEIETELEYLAQADIDALGNPMLYIENLTHDKDIFNSDNIKICKGGSWANGLIYALPGSRQGIGKEKASTKIGFRIVISDLDQEVIKYLPKKNWTPKKSNKKRK